MLWLGKANFLAVYPLLGLYYEYMRARSAIKRKAVYFFSPTRYMCVYQLAKQVAEKLGVPGTGGSDAHNVDDVGTFVTVFDQDIDNDQQLVEALFSGNFRAESGR